MAETANFGWPIPEDGDGQQNGKPWGAGYREFLEDVDTKLHEALTKSSVTRKTITITATAAMGTVDLGEAYTILSEVASGAGRFRLYRTVAERDADLGRAVSTDEAARLAGCVLEDVFTVSALTIEGPDVPGHSGSDGLCAWSWSGPLGSVITLTVLQMEA